MNPMLIIWEEILNTSKVAVTILKNEALCSTTVLGLEETFEH